MEEPWTCSCPKEMCFSEWSSVRSELLVSYIGKLQKIYPSGWAGNANCVAQSGAYLKTALVSAFLGTKFFIVISKLLLTEDSWSTNHFIVNKAAEEIMIRIWFQTILQNLHFANNDNKDDSDKAFEIRTFTKHFNRAFGYAHGKSAYQSIDRYMS